VVALGWNRVIRNIILSTNPAVYFFSIIFPLPFPSLNSAIRARLSDRKMGLAVAIKLKLRPTPLSLELRAIT